MSKCGNCAELVIKRATADCEPPRFRQYGWTFEKTYTLLVHRYSLTLFPPSSLRVTSHLQLLALATLGFRWF